MIIYIEVLHSFSSPTSLILFHETWAREIFKSHSGRTLAKKSIPNPTPFPAVLAIHFENSIAVQSVLRAMMTLSNSMKSLTRKWLSFCTLIIACETESYMCLHGRQFKAVSRYYWPIGIPMGTNCTSLVAHLFLFLMLTLHLDIQTIF